MRATQTSNNPWMDDVASAPSHNVVFVGADELVETPIPSCVAKSFTLQNFDDALRENDPDDGATTDELV